MQGTIANNMTRIDTCKDNNKDERDNDDALSLKLALGLSNSHVLAWLTAYLSTGVLAYTVAFEHWTLIDALYFCTVTWSTVGYGDVVPTSPAAKAFTCVYGLVGLVGVAGAALAAIAGAVAHVERTTTTQQQQQQQTKQRRLTSLFEDMPTILQTYRKSQILLPIAMDVDFDIDDDDSDCDTDTDTDIENEETHLLSKRKPRTSQHNFDIDTNSSRNLFKNSNSNKQRQDKTTALLTMVTSIIQRALPSCLLIFGGSTVLQILNGQPPGDTLTAWIDCIYLGFMTATTIGTGDLSAQTPAARAFAVLYIPVAVAAAGHVLSQAAAAWLQHRQRCVFDQQLVNRLTIQHLACMDANGDGQISRDEYIQFMLLEMGLVAPALLTQLGQQFERLDEDNSGSLDRRDLELMAHLRGARVAERV